MWSNRAARLVPLMAVVCSVLDSRTFMVEGAGCSDKPPSGFPCEMEKIWGKCSEPWMKQGEFCLETCGFCPTDSPTSVEEPVKNPKRKPVKNPKRKPVKNPEEKPVKPAAELPATRDGDLIKVGDTSFEVESPKSIEGTGTRSFDGFDMKCKTIIETLEEIPDASIASGLVSSLKDGDEDLYDLLDDDDTQFTFFVPLDSALGPFMESLEEPDAPAVVSEVLKRHLLNKVIPTSAMKAKTKLTTLSKGSIVVKQSTAAGVTLSKGSDTANIVLSNAWACHSMIHFVDNVLVGAE